MPDTLTKDERKQAIQFQDAIGAIVDQFLQEGMRSELISEVLRDEADSSLEARRFDLRAQS